MTGLYPAIPMCERAWRGRHGLPLGQPGTWVGVSGCPEGRYQGTWWPLGLSHGPPGTLAVWLGASKGFYQCLGALGVPLVGSPCLYEESPSVHRIYWEVPRGGAHPYNLVLHLL